MPESKKRMLICVQAVDLDDPLMGFFMSWLQEAATSFEHLTVLALRVGRYSLPENVTVVPLRRAESYSKVAVVLRVLNESWIRRAAYDGVFVRGDPHYVLCAGWLWRLLGKKTIFWFAHYKVSRAAVWASLLAQVTVTSVRAAFSHPLITPLFIGQSVNHARFTPPQAPSVGPVRCLAFGSVRRVKRVELAIQSFLGAGGEEEGATLDIVGPREDASYEKMLRSLTQGHPSIRWGEAAAYDQVPALLARYGVILNACSGSLDKVIIEGMMSGLVVIASTPGMKDWLPSQLHWLCAVSVEELAHALQRVLALTPEARWKLGLELRTLAIEQHSLQGQVRKIAALVA